LFKKWFRRQCARVPVRNAAAVPVPREAPWTAGIRAARANVVPALMVQLAMLALLLAYYFYPPTTAWLDSLAALKARWGYCYSVVASIAAGALVPEILRILVFQRGKATRTNARNLLFTIPFWSVLALCVDLLYRCQAGWFGNEVTFVVVAKKVLVDQFLFCPLVSGPMTVWFYDFKNRGRLACGVREFFTAAHYRDAVVPVVFATWGVWIPLVSIIYSLPPLLQIPMFALALSLWVVLYTWISEQYRRPD
jgi:hypothetical protein